MELVIHIFAGSIGTMIWGSCLTFIILIKKAGLFPRITKGQYAGYLFLTLFISSCVYTILSLLLPTLSVLYHGVGAERIPYLLKFAVAFVVGYAINKPVINRLSLKLGQAV